ncbi:hypothetical protein RhiirC2_768956 [Rhizophagus irregularis]|uniref:Uncharacterized protein n=1 Tax=Rhizophagus irregularis TaxID=588596 RepID=A0A2N1P0J9_9GLOM|nr:hypothetical protein RhiirC2_768956 [Rhizophagus irregularis]
MCIICWFFEALANLSIEIENIGDGNRENGDVGNIFENIKVDDKLMCNNLIEISYYLNNLYI